jgi:exopolysaccharide biosynthesis polyprenyl glycosylphosphotransferase
MIKEQAKLLTKIAVSLDAIAIASAFFAAYYLRNGEFERIEHYRWILFIVLPVWYYLFVHFQLYAPLRTRSLASIAVSVVKVHALGALITSSAIYFIRPRGFSRGLFMEFILISLTLVLAEKSMLRGILSCVRRLGYNYRNILIVGCNEQAQKLTALIESHAKWGLRIVGFSKLSNEDDWLPIKGYDVLGTLDELVEICKKNPVDEVVFCVPTEALPNLDDHARDMEEMGITMRMVLDLYDLRRSRRELSFFHGQMPMLTFYPKAFNAEHLFVKRCLDILGATAGLCITGILFPFVVLAIKLDSAGPIFFGQNRVGESGRTFRCWKFRSMYIDAEERKKELMHLNEMNGAIFKIKNDPRITRVGQFLRKTSLDELPQFWNVFKGEMSIVGTRPPTPNEVENYENWHRKRICIKPGITGMWQVSGRNQIQNFDEVARLDIEYIDKWNMWLDLKILLRTVWVVLAHKGSC